MSEDQIHYELSVIRTLINESNADLTQQIRESNSATLLSVQARNNELKKDVQGQTNIVKWMIGLLITILMTVGGWLIMDHLCLKDDHKELKTDFGTVLKITSPDNHDFLGYDELMQKYFPIRGGTKGGTQ